MTTTVEVEGVFSDDSDGGDDDAVDENAPPEELAHYNYRLENEINMSL